MRFLIFFLSLLGCNLFAALPMTHIYIAEKWIEGFTSYNVKEKQAFMLGTLFPDVKILGVQPIKDPYKEPASLEMVYMLTNPFEAGKKLHIFLDRLRDELIDKWNIRTLVGYLPQEHIDMFLGLLEDEILYKDQSANTVRQFLSAIYEDEILSGVPVEALIRWHRMLIQYLADRPREMLKKVAEAGEGYLDVSDNIVQQWNEALPLLAKNEKIQRYIKDLTREFEKEFIIYKFSLVQGR